jgi:hypothetical protein
VAQIQSWHICGLASWPRAEQNFLSHLNSLRPAIKFAMEIESDSAIPFLDVLVIRKETTLATKVYRKPTQTGRYLNCSSNHLPHQSVHKRVPTICQECQDLCNEISSLRRDPQLNGNPRGFIGSVINPRGSRRPSKEDRPLGSVHMPYAKGVSEKFKRTGNRYNNLVIFRTKQTPKV